MEIAQVLFLLIFLTANAELDGSLNVPLVTSVDRKYIYLSSTGVMKWISNSTIVQIYIPRLFIIIYKNKEKGKTILILSYNITAASGLNEEQASIQSLASDFAKKEMQPFMSKWDQEV